MAAINRQYFVQRFGALTETELREKHLGLLTADIQIVLSISQIFAMNQQELDEVLIGKFSAKIKHSPFFIVFSPAPGDLAFPKQVFIKPSFWEKYEIWRGKSLHDDLKIPERMFAEESQPHVN